MENDPVRVVAAEPAYLVTATWLVLEHPPARYQQGTILSASELGQDVARLLAAGVIRPATDEDLNRWPAGVLTREDMERILAEGGSVAYDRGPAFPHVIRRAEDLPSNREILANYYSQLRHLARNAGR